jgi:hypothetical protein
VPDCLHSFQLNRLDKISLSLNLNQTGLNPVNYTIKVDKSFQNHDDFKGIFNTDISSSAVIFIWFYDYF